MRIVSAAVALGLLPDQGNAADETAPANPAVPAVRNFLEAIQAKASSPATAPPVAPAFAKTSQVLAYERSLAASHPLAVRVRGTVTFVDPMRPWFFLQDASGAVLVAQGFGGLAVKAGDLVEADGTTRAGTYATYVDMARVAVTGTAPLPVPKKADAAAVRAQRLFSLQTETEGVLRNVVTCNDGRIVMELHTRSGGCLAVLHGASGSFKPAALLGSRLRVRGLNWLQFDGHIQVSAASDSISVITPGPPDVFGQPAVEAAAAPESPPGDTPRLVSAVALFTDVVGRLWLQAADGTAIVAIPFPAFGYAGIQLMPPVVPAAGDRVQLLGNFSRENGMVIARSAQYRILGRGEAQPWPLSTTPKGVSDPARLGRLVTLRGRLTGTEVRRFNSYRGGSYQVPVLKLEEDGATVEVFGPPEAAKDFGALPVDNMVQVTGYNVATDPQQVWLRTALDFTNEGRSGRSVMQVFRWWLTAFGVAVVMGGGFIWALREKLKRQRSEAALLKASEARVLEVNASLEQRVSERTNELASANERLRRASEDALSRLARERELGDLKSNFVSMVSHEFRTPLAVILSSTELLSNHLERLPQERRAQQLTSIRGSTQQMARLIEEVLLLGKVEAGRMTYDPAPLNLREFCSTLVDEALSATHQRCPVELTCAENLPEIVSADAALLRHVFSNLLSNASRYSTEGRPVKFTAAMEDDRLVFRITDSGIGIPAEDLPHLFEAFHRAKNVGSVSGTGLGLMIAKRCVELHGGTVEVVSTVGAGTEVTVSLKDYV